MMMSSEPPTHRVRAVLAVLAALAAAGIACGLAIAVGPASAAVDDAPDSRRGRPVLMGSVGPEFEIEISDRSVPAGKYKLVVRDKSTIHNFHILGRGVDEATTITGTGKEIYKIKLKPGRYTIQCDPHQFVMFTKLRVT